MHQSGRFSTSYPKQSSLPFIATSWLNMSEYSSHSFRIGAATTAAAAEIPS